MFNRKWTVVETIKNIAKASNKEEIIYYENRLSFQFAFPILIFGAITNYTGRYLEDGEMLADVLIDSGLMLAGALLFYLILKYVKNINIQQDLFNVLFVGTYAMIFTHLYHVMGPSIWAIGMILVMIAMLQLRIKMLIMIIVSIFSSLIYIWIKNPPFIFTDTYYFVQLTGYAFTFVVAWTAHRITRLRNKTIMKQYAQISKSEEIWRETLVAVGDGVIVVDSEGVIEFMNPTASKLSGWEEKDAIGSDLTRVFKISRADKEHLGYENDFVSIVGYPSDCIICSKLGIKRYIELCTGRVKSSKGLTSGYVIVFHDVTQKNAERKQIEYLSYHDQLTGLYNRRYYEEEIKRIDTERQLPITVIYGDVNNLKLMNDSYGHEDGDQLIVKVADIIGSHIRQEEILARVGGDEFVLLLPRTTEKEASALIDRIEETLRGQSHLGIELSISLGAATKCDSRESLKMTVKKSEEAMYINKARTKKVVKESYIGHQIEETEWTI